MADTFPLDLTSLRAVLDYLNLGVYITDRDRRILLWNRKAEIITGHRAADVEGMTCHDNVLVHVDKDQHRLCTSELCPLHRSILLDKESDGALLVFARRADGQRVAVSVSTAPLHAADGTIIGGIEVFRDESSHVRDLEFARRVQRHILPDQLPKPDGFGFESAYYPHDLVGGDFYDVREVAPGRFGFLVADVRGHGVSAALYTMCLRSISQSLAAQAAWPDAFMTAMNRELSRFVLDESFATAFYGVLDTANGEVRYSNAGHPSPLHHAAASGDVQPLETHGMPLGIMADGTYEASVLSMQPGDLLLCYTDGVTEAVDAKGVMFGEKGLAELLRTQIAKGHANLPDRLYRHVKSHCGTVALADDVLLLALRRDNS